MGLRNRKGLSVLTGAVVLALTAPQALVAQEGWNFTLMGETSGEVVAAERRTSGELGPTSVVEANVSFEAAHDYGGAFVKLAADDILGGTLVLGGTMVQGGGLYRWINLDESYVWMHFLAPFGIAKETADLKAKVGLFDGRATVAEAVVDDDPMEESFGALVEVGDSWLPVTKEDPNNPAARVDDTELTQQAGVVAQLDLKIIDLIIWRSLFFLGDWNQHDTADLSTGLIMDGLEVASGHMISASISLTADLRDTTNSNYILKADSNEEEDVTDTLTVAAAYDGDLGGDMMLKVRGDVGFNNLIGWTNEDEDIDGAKNSDEDPWKSNQAFVGWHGGVSFSFGDWITLGLDLGGRSAQRAAYDYKVVDGEASDEITPDQLIRYYLFEVSSNAVKAATNDDVMLDLFIRAALDTTRSEDYLLRSIEFGATYTLLESDEGNLWVKLGYGLVVEDPDSDNPAREGRYDYDVDNMKEESAGLYFKAGGDFKKVF